jgi:hypothetical protein
MTDLEKLFVNTTVDLKERQEKGTEYDLIRASGLLRQLLFDGSPLVDQVNKDYRLKIRFKTQKNNIDFSKKTMWNGVEAETIIGVRWIKPNHNDEEYLSYLTITDFLKYPVIYFADQDFTVLDILKLCAHFYGGIHHDKVKKREQIYLDWANKTVAYGDGLNCAVESIKSIIEIVIEGLTPLIDKIKKKTFANT